MKMKKYVLLLRGNLKVTMLKIKQYSKVRQHCYDTGEYTSVLHRIYNL